MMKLADYFYLPSPIEYVEVSVGPVIGIVTDTTARVLIEFKESDTQSQSHVNPRWLKTENEDSHLNYPSNRKFITCYLKEEDGEFLPRRLPLKVNTPMVFPFNGLTPGKKYSVELHCPLPVKRSSFYTLGRKEWGILNAGIVSCHETFTQRKKPLQKDLWSNLAWSIDNHELDYVFHIGDQVYMDMNGDAKEPTVYDLCYKKLRDNHGNWGNDVTEYILDLLRKKYRSTWTDPSVADVLANVPNLMICDDHEFRDDWGWRAVDTTPGTEDYFYGKLAKQVYDEYQRQLREDITSTNPRYEYHSHVLNGVGVSFIEYRGCRSWYEEHYLEETHFGAAQTEWVRSLFQRGGKFDTAGSVIFLTPVPLLLLHQYVSKGAYWINKLAGYIKIDLLEDDIQEYWTTASVDALIKLLNLFIDWKKRIAGRELLVVGGDFHLGGWTDIYYKNEMVFHPLLVPNPIGGMDFF